MLYLLVPWTAVNLTDYFFVRRGHYAIADLFTSNGSDPELAHPVS